MRDALRDRPRDPGLPRESRAARPPGPVTVGGAHPSDISIFTHEPALPKRRGVEPGVARAAIDVDNYVDLVQVLVLVLVLNLCSIYAC